MRLEVKCNECYGDSHTLPLDSIAKCRVHGFLRVRTLLHELVEGEDRPCRFDHHGYCQEHSSFGEPGSCLTADAREALGLDANS